ncbi:uncharacterized protein LOC135392401 [Ornithodoros turicata]|uniref:uncharacterized protein LOC135392401 n=1 Tax=Ornithodoros turicata TaxID=34597 RepID=UPI003138A936
MEDCKPIKTPMEVGQRNDTTTATAAEKNPNVPFQSLIGNLMYLVQGPRPDLAFVSHYLSQFNLNHTLSHWGMAKGVLRYLKGTRNIGTTYTACKEPITAYTDASWNECGTGRSRSGYVFTMSMGAISWRSTRQQLIALSTCEAEYIAFTEGLKEGKWIKTFMAELGFNSYGTQTLEVRCDNQNN